MTESDNRLEKVRLSTWRHLGHRNQFVAHRNTLSQPVSAPPVTQYWLTTLKPRKSLNLLRQALGQMGGTPADRTRIETPEEISDDPAERFFDA